MARKPLDHHILDELDLAAQRAAWLRQVVAFIEELPIADRRRLVFEGLVLVEEGRPWNEVTVRRTTTRRSKRTGRPPLPPGEAKNVVFVLRMAVAEREVIEEAANKAGVSTSAWARAELCDAAAFELGR